MLLIDLGELSSTRLRHCITRTFNRRATHPLASSVPPRPPEWKSVFARLATEGGIEPDLTRAFQILSEFWNSLALVSRAAEAPSHRSCPHKPGSACQPSAAFDRCALFVQSVARAAMDSRVDPRLSAFPTFVDSILHKLHPSPLTNALAVPHGKVDVFAFHTPPFLVKEDAGFIGTRIQCHSLAGHVCGKASATQGQRECVCD